MIVSVHHQIAVTVPVVSVGINKAHNILFLNVLLRLSNLKNVDAVILL